MAFKLVPGWTEEDIDDEAILSRMCVEDTMVKCVSAKDNELPRHHCKALELVGTAVLIDSCLLCLGRPLGGIQLAHGLGWVLAHGGGVAFPGIQQKREGLLSLQLIFNIIVRLLLAGTRRRPDDLQVSQLELPD